MKKFASYGPAIIVLLSVIVALVAVPQIIGRYAYSQQEAKITLARSVLAKDDVLRSIDRATSAIADSNEPSVVHIETHLPQSLSNGSAPPTSFSTGAGWVYDDRGHVITNAHVVRSAESVSVEFFNGRIVRGDVIGMDPYTDIAVIRTPSPENNFAARRATNRLPRTGERVYAFGSPFGFKFSMSEGIVSGLGREAAGSNVPGGYTNYIQTDAAVNPGNSGGPLVNSDGHVIGMNVAIATAKSVGEAPESSGSDSAGISFAIPLGTIEPIVDQIIQYGKVSRGYLGIRYNRADVIHLDTPLGDQSSITGIQITTVESPGPSYDAGLQVNDVIVEIQGSPIINSESLSSLISSSRAGDTIDVRVFRDNTFYEYQVMLGQMKNEVLAERIYQPIMLQLGMTLSQQRNKVIVRMVYPSFPGFNAGFQSGDIITHVNGKTYDDYSHFFVLIADEGILTGSEIRFTVQNSSGEVRDILLNLKW